MPFPSFFAKVKAFFVSTWNFIKKSMKGHPNINVERARDVIIFAPTVSAGHDVKDVIMKLEPSHWPDKVKSSASIVPTAITLPKVLSLNAQAILVYKSIMRNLNKASEILDPVVAQALYLSCTHKAAILAKNNDLAKFVEEKLEKMSNFRSQDGYIPPDIKRWYKRFVEIDLRGNLVGVVIPVLELASEKLLIHPSEFGKVRNECRRFVRWLYTSISKPEEPKRFHFKGKYLNVGLVYIAELNWVSYFTISMGLLTEQKCNPLIVMAYGSAYTTKSVKVCCFLDKLDRRECGLSRIILTPKLESLESGETKPYLSSYFFNHPHFIEKKNKLDKEWEAWQLKLSHRRVNVTDEQIGFSQISKLISDGNPVIVEHTWDTLQQFLDVCFEIILQNKGKIVSHKIEMRTDGEETQDKPWSKLSFVLAPCES